MKYSRGRASPIDPDCVDVRPLPGYARQVRVRNRTEAAGECCPDTARYRCPHANGHQDSKSAAEESEDARSRRRRSGRAGWTCRSERRHGRGSVVAEIDLRPDRYLLQLRRKAPSPCFAQQAVGEVEATSASPHRCRQAAVGEAGPGRRGDIAVEALRRRTPRFRLSRRNRKV